MGTAIMTMDTMEVIIVVITAVFIITVDITEAVIIIVVIMEIIMGITEADITATEDTMEMVITVVIMAVITETSIVEIVMDVVVTDVEVITCLDALPFSLYSSLFLQLLIEPSISNDLYEF